MKTKLEKAILDSMNKNPNNWKGIFYKNPDDPRIIVRRIRPALGWSLNWASPYSYLSFICLILVTIAAIVFL